MKLEICSFSGYKIYPAKGKVFVRSDSSPRKIRWTQIYRRVNKKGISVEVRAKRTRRTVKHERAVVGASWEEIRAKRTEKPEARAAARQAAKDAKKSSKPAAAKKA
ncbi:hypothetical protein RO3G_00264 [Lichtheimia corymbifera JMRC:FSU:9682]|uniref:Large ribosomal subunit protein eL24-related N-terminal domain-containing protein n=1 Tax=Lichtheimia corymbifera JMRC:FSU:9682 TaxID=1263082 RepID=A0A068RKU9_9FUNG|nr:hypothetical protein RO3G_00264 [Lichtheimia corymbifera JMRC:FSU:9682]